MYVIQLAVEDELSQSLAFRILEASPRDFFIYQTLGRQGKGYLESKIDGFNRAARNIPFFVLIDLDAEECAPRSIRDLLPNGISAGLVLRYAIRAAESWVLADRRGFTSLLGVPIGRVPTNTDTITDPKRFLLSVVRRSRRTRLKDELLPAHGSTARVGPNYNGVLTEFVRKQWNIEEAIRHSDSLRRAIQAVDNFTFHLHRS